MESPRFHPTILESREAIGNALAVAQARMLTLTSEEKTGISPSTAASFYEERLVKRSAGECGVESVQSLYYLTKEYSHLFDKMFLLSATQQFGDAFKEKWKHHVYFFVEDREGTWIACSPANYKTTGYNRFSTFIQNRSLATVLDTIQERDGGSWPSDAYIEYTLSRVAHRPIIENITGTTLSQFSFMVMTQRNKYNSATYSSAIMNANGSIKDSLPPK